MAIKYSIGDIIQSKKQHPCGNDQWEVIRVGMDFKMKCLKCGRIVMLPREKFEKAVKKVLVAAHEATEDDV
ncbi:MAG TPA: DUF951 domain-containing protein [Clostridiales bacterium]|nr:DUF951 domain-containing protein [Clostridiales bacterium]